MKPFYEQYRDSDNELLITSREDYSFPLHFHAAVEIFILLKGKYKVTVDNNTYEMDERSILIADSFCMHSYTKLTKEPSQSLMLIIPSVYLLEYNELKNEQTLKSYVTKNEKIFKEICGLTEFLKDHLDNERLKTNYTNALLLLLLEDLGTMPSTQKKDLTTIKNLLYYIENHFKENITLESISKHFGYSSCHLSRLFHSYFTISISRYINNMRIKYIESKKTTADNLLALIYESGFQSPQTYYRNLKYFREQN